MEDTMDQSQTNQSFNKYQPIDWRQYFTLDELTEAFNKIQNGLDPNDEEIDLSSDNGEEGGSDSCPSDDNIDL